MNGFQVFEKDTSGFVGDNSYLKGTEEGFTMLSFFK